jgi:hypothetical protein
MAIPICRKLLAHWRGVHFPCARKDWKRSEAIIAD